MAEEHVPHNSSKTFVIFDVETTGLNPAQDELLEIGAEKLIDGKVIDTFHALLKSDRPVPQEAIAIHGITEELLQKEGREPVEVLGDFLSFISGSVLVGHNVGFDISFIDSYSKKLGLLPCTNQTLDTCEIARKYLIIPSYSLDRVATYFGIINQQKHRAQSDVQTTRLVFLKLLERAYASKKPGA